ncbi:hypothetical protein BYT27DRAFT_7209097 [Phlegmacium glaucopus]|nr:hypothetical protein BYT27DRAFT_7209097 [Phlegmacium glaucopus]
MTVIDNASGRKICLDFWPPPSELASIPRLIGFGAQHDTRRVFLGYPATAASKYIDITFEDSGRAVNRAAWEFCKAIGARRLSSEPPNVVEILSRSSTFVIAEKPFVNLLKLTDSAAVITDSAEAEASAAELGSLPVYDIAPFPTPGIPASDPFPFNLQWEEECDEPAIILHTSSSTGLPKPVAWNSLFVFHQDFYPPDPSSFIPRIWHRVRHSFGSDGGSFSQTQRNQSPPPISWMSVKGRYAPEVVIGAHSMIEEVAIIEGGMDFMRGRRFWFFVGAPVLPQLGDFLVKEKIHFLSMLEPGEGPFELIILAKNGWKSGTINVNIEGVEGYSTSDLYQKYHSHISSSTADLQMTSSFLPTGRRRPMEVPIEAHRHLRVTPPPLCSVQAERKILVEPAGSFVFDPSDEPLLVAFRNEIWPAVHASSPLRWQIWKEVILSTSPDKPLPRTDKGGVPQNFVFLFTTSRAMADAATNLIKTGRVVAEDVESAHASMINEMVQKYTASCPTHTPGAAANDEMGEVVILTASTGSLGPFILDTLIHEKRVYKVFCFNKHGSIPTLARQQGSFDERELDPPLLSKLAADGHVVFFDIEISAPFCGLAEDIFKVLYNCMGAQLQSAAEHL